MSGYFFKKKGIAVLALSLFLLGCNEENLQPVPLPGPTETSFINEEFGMTFSFPAGSIQSIDRNEEGMFIELASGKAHARISAYSLDALPDWRSLAEVNEKGSPYKVVTIAGKKAWQYGSYDDRDHFMTYTAFFGKTHVYWVKSDQSSKNADKAFVDQILESLTFASE